MNYEKERKIVLEEIARDRSQPDYEIGNRRQKKSLAGDRVGAVRHRILRIAGRYRARPGRRVLQPALRAGQYDPACDRGLRARSGDRLGARVLPVVERRRCAGGVRSVANR